MSRYHPALVALHWLLAAFLLIALGMGGLVMAETPNTDPEKLSLLRNHMVFGGVILVLMLVRLGVRLRSATPPHADIGNALLNRVGVWTHWVLYGVVIAMAASGIGTSLAAGLPDIVFFGSGAPLPESFDIYTPRLVHGALASILMALIAAHVAAALYHQLVRKDGLFSRMWFGPRQG